MSTDYTFSYSATACSFTSGYRACSWNSWPLSSNLHPHTEVARRAASVVHYGSFPRAGNAGVREPGRALQKRRRAWLRAPGMAMTDCRRANTGFSRTSPSFPGWTRLAEKQHTNSTVRVAAFQQLTRHRTCQNARIAWFDVNPSGICGNIRYPEVGPASV